MSKSLLKRLVSIISFISCIGVVLGLATNTTGQGNNQIYLPLVVSPPSPTTVVSVNSDGTQGNGGSFAPSISADGRYIAFSSEATNLVANDTNGVYDVFVHDQQTGLTSRISVASDGTQGNGESTTPFISSDGRYITFLSAATNLVTNDTNNIVDVFFHDRQTGETSRVSVASDGTQGNANSFDPSISADGRYIVFGSMANNLVPGDNPFYTADIFLHDRQTGETTHITNDGIQSDQYYGPRISANGQYVTFYSSAANLVPNDTNHVTDIFVYNLQTEEYSRVSVTSEGTPANNPSQNPSISVDGRYVAFDSLADNLVTNDTNTNPDIFVHDRQTGITIRVSVTSDGTQHSGSSSHPVISANGSFVAFEVIGHLVPEDTNIATDVYIHDIQTGETSLISQTPSGTSGNQDSYAPAISGDGRYAAFFSFADNLISNDANSSISDVFVRDRWMEP
jgi:Tol biopolymer transport system component